MSLFCLVHGSTQNASGWAMLVPELQRRVRLRQDLAAALRGLRDKRKISLSGAIEAATGYIEACSDPEARKLDNECAFIGGYIPISPVNPGEGVQGGVS